MSDLGYLHNKTLALKKKKKKKMIAYVATTSKLDMSIQASLICISSEEGTAMVIYLLTIQTGDKLTFIIYLYGDSSLMFLLA